MFYHAARALRMEDGKVRRVDAWYGFGFAAGGATAAAAAWNASWLWARWLRPEAGPPRRRFAAGALALLNAGVAVESTAAQGLYVAQHAGWDTTPFFVPAAWIGARAGLLAGTLLLSLLIVRRAR